MDFIQPRRKLRIYSPVLLLARLVLYLWLDRTAVQHLHFGEPLRCFQADTFPPSRYVTPLVKAHVCGRADGYGYGRVRGDARV